MVLTFKLFILNLLFSCSRMIPAAKILRILTYPAALPLHIACKIVDRLTGLLPRYVQVIPCVFHCFPVINVKLLIEGQAFIWIKSCLPANRFKGDWGPNILARLVWLSFCKGFVTVAFSIGKQWEAHRTGLPFK